MTTLAEVKVVTADECPCDFKKDPEFHDRILGIESTSPVEAGELVALIINDDDPLTGSPGGHLFDDPDDFGRFVAQHNWSDPFSMALLAERVDFASNQAWQAPERHRMRMLRHGDSED